MYDSILVPTDGSPGVEGVILRALDLAETYDATVHVLSVIPPTPDLDTKGELTPLQAASKKRAREETVQIVGLAEEAGLDATRAVHEGVPYRTILDYCDDHGIDLVVMGTHGRTGADLATLGSTTERVLTFGSVPVLVVQLQEGVTAPEPGIGMYDDVVIATDGSDAAERAAEYGLALAERYGADVHVAYVVDTTTYALGDAPRSVVGLLKEGGRKTAETISHDARDRNLPAEADVLRGHPSEELLAYADGVGADLIVMGTRGHGTSSDHLLGSTTGQVLRASEIPVLSVS